MRHFGNLRDIKETFGGLMERTEIDIKEDFDGRHQDIEKHMKTC